PPRQPGRGPHGAGGVRARAGRRPRRRGVAGVAPPGGGGCRGRAPGGGVGAGGAPRAGGPRGRGAPRRRRRRAGAGPLGGGARRGAAAPGAARRRLPRGPLGRARRAPRPRGLAVRAARCPAPARRRRRSPRAAAAGVGVPRGNPRGPGPVQAMTSAMLARVRSALVLACGILLGGGAAAATEIATGRPADVRGTSVELVTIPGGTFIQGVDLIEINDLRGACRAEHFGVSTVLCEKDDFFYKLLGRTREVYLSAYAIDRYEVS